MMNVIALTKELIKFNTTNPPGNEEESAKYVGNLLSQNGFDVEYPRFEEHRLHVIATKGLSAKRAPLVLLGHLDVVPIGKNEWKTDPFSGSIIDGKLYGRGSSDMKGSVAAIICAAVESFEKDNPVGGIKIILTAGEELGCIGASSLMNSGYNIGKANAMIVGEPTSNYPFIGHKGALYINAETRGITAHSSMPELGVNAIYKAARAILKIEKYKFNVKEDLLLGYPTLNVGKINGGQNLNSVPDKVDFTIDVRTTTKLLNNEVLNVLRYELGEDVKIEPIVNLNAIATSEDDPFVKMVYEACHIDTSHKGRKKSAPFLTDASVIKPWLGNPPTIILGCGEPSMAHQTDEYCFVDKIEELVKIYINIIKCNGELN